MFPGLGAATVLFLGYLGVEKLWERADNSLFRYSERAVAAYREGYVQGLREKGALRAEN